MDSFSSIGPLCLHFTSMQKLWDLNLYGVKIAEICTCKNEIQWVLAKLSYSLCALISVSTYRFRDNKILWGLHQNVAF